MKWCAVVSGLRGVDIHYEEVWRASIWVRFLLVCATLKCLFEPDDISVERLDENSCICGRMYFKNDRLLHLPIVIITMSLTPAKWSCIEKLVLIECVPTLLRSMPRVSSPMELHVRRRKAIMSSADVTEGVPFSFI